MEITEIPIEEINISPSQPRHDFNIKKMQALTTSIKKHGVLQPIQVSKTGNKYQLVSGERRLRAAKANGLTTIPAIILPEITDQQKSELALIENIQRENLNPIEKALAFKDIIERHQKTHEELGQMFGMSRPTITNILRLLKLPQNIQDKLINGVISERQAVTLLRYNNKKEMQKQAAAAACQGQSSQKLRDPNTFSEISVQEYSQIPSLAYAAIKTKMPTLQQWNILSQLNAAPPWKLVKEAALKTCRDCPLLERRDLKETERI